MTARGTALKVLAPEASAIRSATGRPSPNSAAAHRAKIDEIKARRPQTPPTPDDQQAAAPSRGRRAWEATKGAATDQTGAPSWFQAAANPQPIRAANAGGGFLLGVGAWVIARTYLEGGPDAVKKLLKAKFLNKVS